MPLQKSIFWASGSATKQFQKNRFFLTFGQILIVLGSFTNKNVISGPVPATKQFQKNSFFLTFGHILIVLASFTNKNMIQGQYMRRNTR